MNKKMLKVALVDLDAVKSRFPDTKTFIDDTLKENCEKENITADEVIFYKLESIIISKATEFKELNKKAEEIQESEEAAKVVKQYKDIIKTKRE